MKKKIKISLILSLAIIFGCFSNVFAASNQNNKIKKIAEVKKSVRLLDSATTANYVPKKDYSQNLIANYKLNETSGTTCIDSVHNNSTYNGTYNGTTSKTDSDGTCRSFNGQDNYVSFNNFVMDTGKKSIKFRMKMGGKPSHYESVMANQYSWLDAGDRIEITSSGMLNWVNNGGGNVGNVATDNSNNANYYVATDISSYLDNKFHTYLLTWDGTLNDNGIKIYIDDMTTPIATFKAKNNVIKNPVYNLLVGRSVLDENFNGSGSYRYFNGDLADIEIYDDVVEYNNITEELTLNKTIDKLSVGQTDTLIATVTPDNATNKTVKWTSSDRTIVSVDENGKITASGKGTATITATIDGTNLSKSCIVTVDDPLILNIEPEKTKINLNDTVSANLTIDNIQDIAAEDVRIKYDSTRLQFLNYAEVDGIKLVENDVKDGELRFILASKGKVNIIDAKKILLKLNFKGIAAGDALVDVTNGRVSDGITKEWDLTDEQCGQATITIQKLSDVNNSGEYTLLDLAIDARHEGEDPNTLPQYNTDQDGNKAIDDDDLTLIGKYMLENVNYTPNNIK